MSNLRRIFYISRTQNELDGPAVKDIVFRAQRANRQLDVTGVLAHSGRHFAQILEGTDEALAVLVPKIGRDQRHSDVRVIFDQPIVRRDYADWSMGFLYDASLDDQIGRLFELPANDPVDDMGGALAGLIATHMGDLARP